MKIETFIKIHCNSDKNYGDKGYGRGISCGRGTSEDYGYGNESDGADGHGNGIGWGYSQDSVNLIKNE